MMRHPWTFAATLFAFGMIGWVLVEERPQKGRYGRRAFMP
jgi:hypothetical protein